MLERAWRKENPPTLWWEHKLVQPLWRTVWRFPKKLKIELPYDLVIPFLGIYLEKNIIRKDTCTPIFTAALFTIIKTWKQPRCPLTEGWKKTWYVCIAEYQSALKKNKIISFAATWLDLESVILSQVSQTEKEKYHMAPLICGIYKEMI